jgi:hypothetical protein
LSTWTVRFGRTVDIDRWAEGRSVDVIAGLHSWISTCIESGPPDDAWLSEVEEGYRYRYWIIEINVTVEFIAVTYEQWMMGTRID